MNFNTKLPKTRKNGDMSWVIENRLIELDQLLAISETDLFDTMELLYFEEVVSKHGVPVSIILDRDAGITQKF